MKKKLFFSLAFFSACILLGLIACFPTPNKLPTVYFSDEFRSYIDFAEGSYWIYKDSASHKIDSILLKNKTKKIKEPDGDGCYKEVINEELYSSFYGKMVSSGSKSECGGSQEYFMGPVVGIFMGNTQYVKDSKETQIGEMGTNSSVYISKYDSLEIMSNTYYQVRVYKNDLGISFIGKTMYWAKNIGVVKRETADGRVWLLIDYHHN